MADAIPTLWAVFPLYSWKGVLLNGKTCFGFSWIGVWVAGLLGEMRWVWVVASGSSVEKYLVDRNTFFFKKMLGLDCVMDYEM